MWPPAIPNASDRQVFGAEKSGRKINSEILYDQVYIDQRFTITNKDPARVIQIPVVATTLLSGRATIGALSHIQRNDFP